MEQRGCYVLFFDISFRRSFRAFRSVGRSAAKTMRPSTIPLPSSLFCPLHSFSRIREGEECRLFVALDPVRVWGKSDRERKETHKEMEGGGVYGRTARGGHVLPTWEEGILFAEKQEKTMLTLTYLTKSRKVRNHFVLSLHSQSLISQLSILSPGGNCRFLLRRHADLLPFFRGVEP